MCIRDRDSSLSDFYKEKPEGFYAEELEQARTRVWEALRPFRMTLLRLAPARFIHFGTTHEIIELMTEKIDEYRYLGWSSCVNRCV